MSDAFADLWNTSAPSKPAQSRTLGSQTPPSAPKRQQPDVFALLASSNPPSRPGTGFSQTQKPTQSPSPKPTTSNASGDAFSGLFTSSPSSLQSNSNLTIAQRAAEAEKKKLEALRRHQHAHQATQSQTPSAWDGLDSLMSPGSRQPATTTKQSLQDDLGFDAFTQPTPAKSAVGQSKTSSPFDDDDLLGDFAAPSRPAQVKAPVAVPRQTSQGWDSPPRPTRTDSPGDFDFGDRENRDALLDDSSGEEDILGALGKPVDARPAKKSNYSDTNRQTTSPPTRPASSSRPNAPSRPVSPPPHILGQIVEMGFSVQQAKVALASTDTGLDVQAALEALLSNGAASSSPRRHTPQLRDQHPQSPDAPSSGQPPRSASHLLAGDPARGPSPSDNDRNIQEQADKIIAQASEVGRSMFNKASAFWKEGKERVQKAYVERAATAGTTTPGGGRPKWMQEAREENGWEDNDSPMKSAFADEPSSRPQAEQARPAPAPRPNPQQQSSQEQQGRASRIANLFGDEEPVAYVSPFRRGKAREQPSAPTVQPTSAPPPPAAVPPRPAPPKPRQNVVSCSPSVLARSTQYKTRGSEQFKLGQYADAASSYTFGITALPDGHLALVPLYNNRALARLKTGEYAGAIEDATAVISLIGEGYHPIREAKVQKEDEGAGIDLGDGLVKAIKRRAEANEGRERWKEAEKDWELLSQLDFAPSGIKAEAVKNTGRCRRTVASLQEKDSASSTPAAPKPKPKAVPPRPRPAVPAKPSQALKDLRSANEAAEAEDQQRHELKDGVDAKLTAWKGGKENNIRALLGSVDTVLWPELGFKKVGMAELVTPAQVKIRYTKVIARLHPDKLNANNTTVEQRMIANAVFGALNEAWNSFKQ